MFLKKPETVFANGVGVVVDLADSVYSFYYSDNYAYTVLVWSLTMCDCVRVVNVYTDMTMTMRTSMIILEDTYSTDFYGTTERKKYLGVLTYPTTVINK